MRFWLTVVMAFAVASSGAVAQKRAITEKDLFAFHWIGDAEVSPDGMRVLTGSFDGTVLLWNVSASNPPAPRILSAAMLAPNGPFQIRLQGETGVSYRLEGSTNLLNWTSLITTHLTTGEWEWNDPQSPPLSQRFYRAVLP